MKQLATDMRLLKLWVARTSIRIDTQPSTT